MLIYKLETAGCRVCKELEEKTSDCCEKNKKSSWDMHTGVLYNEPFLLCNYGEVSAVQIWTPGSKKDMK